MLFILVKNNLKLMFRDKLTMFIFIVFPVMLIAILSSAFSKTLDKNYTIKPFSVGYSIENGSNIEKNLPSFIKSFEKNKISFSKMGIGQGIDKVKNESITAFIEMDDNKYTIYKRDGLNVNTAIFENGIGSMMYFYDGNKTLMSYMAEKGIPIKIENENKTDNSNFVNLETIKVNPMPTSTVYYGIVEVVYIIWFGMITASFIVSKERKNGVTRRIGLSNANSFIVFCGKLIPAVISISIQIGIATLASIILMGVNWGNSPLLSAGIILLEIIASPALGILMAIIIKSEVLVGVIVFLSSFFFGFIGGTFQTYMFNLVSDNLTKVSPLYYINRTLVEISTMGHSDYTNRCILLLTVIFLVAIVTGTAALTSAKGREAL